MSTRARSSDPPGRIRPSRNGTDLGFTTEWFTGSGTYNIVLFGDTHRSNIDVADSHNNDMAAAFSTASAPTADTVPSLLLSGMVRVAHNPNYLTDPGLSMNGAKTPVSSFTGRNGYWYGLFVRGNVHAKCTTDAQCGGGLKCDKTMGGIPSPDWETFRACWKTHSAQFGCSNIEGNTNIGICRDKTSSMATFANPNVLDGITYFDATDNAQRSETGKIYSSAMVSEIGSPELNVINYVTSSFVTNKFLNVTTRATVSNTDYRRPTATMPSATVYAWGRPSFFSNGARGATSELYLARAVNPATTGPITFSYRNAAGAWVSNQTDAAPLPVTGGWDNGPANHISVTYLTNASKWLMLYGGEIPQLWRDLFGGSIVAGVPATNGTIKMRTATHPWGPWSAPTVVLAPTSSTISGSFCQFGGQNCNPLIPLFPEQGPGVLYGPAIVEAWTQSTATTATIGWFVSLWNPYQVQQIKTTITL